MKKSNSKPDKVESLIHVIKHGSFLQHEEAIKALEEIGDKRAIAPLVEVLKGEFQSRTKRFAADTLEKLGWEPAENTDKAYLLIVKERWEELAELGLEYLILALKGGNERQVMPYFVKIGKSAVEPLIKALESKNYERGAIATILGELGDKKAVESLAQILKDRDESYDLKRKVAQALNKLNFEPRDNIERVYLLAATNRWDEAAELGEPAIEPLIQVLRRFGKPGAREAFAKIGKPAVGSLIQALEDHAGWARFSTATALGEIGDKRAVEPLTQLLKNEKDDEIKEAAEKALEKIKIKV